MPDLGFQLRRLTRSKPRVSASRSASSVGMRLADCCQTTDCGPSMTAVATSSPRLAGRQWRKIASGLASAISSSVTWKGASAARTRLPLGLLAHRGPDVGVDGVGARDGRGGIVHDGQLGTRVLGEPPRVREDLLVRCVLRRAGDRDVEAGERARSRAASGRRCRRRRRRRRAGARRCRRTPPRSSAGRPAPGRDGARRRERSRPARSPTGPARRPSPGRTCESRSPRRSQRASGRCRRSTRLAPAAAPAATATPASRRAGRLPLRTRRASASTASRRCRRSSRLEGRPRSGPASLFIAAARSSSSRSSSGVRSATRVKWRADGVGARGAHTLGHVSCRRRAHRHHPVTTVSGWAVFAWVTIGSSTSAIVGVPTSSSS